MVLLSLVGLLEARHISVARVVGEHFGILVGHSPLTTDNHLPALESICSVTASLADGKAAGEDCIASELFQYPITPLRSALLPQPLTVKEYVQDTPPLQWCGTCHETLEVTGLVCAAQ